MRTTLLIVAVAAGNAYALQTLYGQCGGISFHGSSTCSATATCSTLNPFYAQCLPIKPSVAKAAVTAAPVLAVNPGYSQCGGISYHGATTCPVGAVCSTLNPFYAQCLLPKSSAPVQAAVTSAPSSAVHALANCTITVTLPKSSSPAAVAAVSPAVAPNPSASSPAAGVPSAAAAVPSSMSVPPTAAIVSSSTSVSPAAALNPSASSPPAAVPPAAVPPLPAIVPAGKISHAGINIAGFDFGCTIDGTCITTSVTPPGANGIAQIQHFITNDGLNTFRLPVGWQFLVNNNVGGTLDAANFAQYDALVQGCLQAGAAMCLIDIHNYARYNGAIIGQGGPTDAQFASLWSQIAAKYKNTANVAFGIMNEPHDIPSITTWATSVQAAVTAIRQAGATTQMILLPGSNFASAAAFISNGSGAALLKVTNPDGSTNNLIFEVHKYLDVDNSGTHVNCVTNNTAVFQTLGDWLRVNKRQAILAETGGGSADPTCLMNLCQQLAQINVYSDVYLGWIGWAAGSFQTSYVLSMTPLGTPGNFMDQPLVTQCIVGQLK